MTCTTPFPAVTSGRVTSAPPIFTVPIEKKYT